MEKKRKKRGHVAIPFLLTFLLSIVGIGGVALLIFQKIDKQDDLQKMSSTFTAPTAEDNMTLLFILDEETDPCPLTFLVARILPAEKKIMLVSLPANMLSLFNGNNDTIGNFYRNYGAQAAESAIQNECGITIDRYMILDTDALQKVCNIFGGVNYLVPIETKGFEDSSTPQYLGPAQVEKLITYPLFEHGESERSMVTADLMCEMLNQTDYDRIVATMDSNFQKMVNMTETDISYIDYSNHKNALRFLFNYGSKVGRSRIAIGTNSDDNFILDSGFYNTVSEFFTETSEGE